MLAIGVTTTALGLIIVGGVLVPPLLPNMAWSVPQASHVARSALSRAKRDRERARARKRLFSSISKHTPVPGMPAARLPIVRKWWDYMAPLMEVHSDNAPKEWPLREMFHLD